MLYQTQNVNVYQYSVQMICEKNILNIYSIHHNIQRITCLVFESFDVHSSSNWYKTEVLEFSVKNNWMPSASCDVSQPNLRKRQ